MSGDGCGLSDDGVAVSRGLRVVSKIAKDVCYCVGTALRELVLAEERHMCRMVL